ncbi:ATP-dependent nuclease [Pseudonocardia artemisiae]
MYEKFDLELTSGVNIIVGDNDCGKSTLLEAVSLALTGRLHGRLLAQELSPYLFNERATRAYIEALQAGMAPQPPEIIIDLFLDDAKVPAALRGTNNLLAEDRPGVRIRVAPNPDFSLEYADFIKEPAKVNLIPTEYYTVDWLGFSGNGITFRSIPATASLIDATSIRLQSGADYYLQGIINESLEVRERVELSRAYRSLREQFSANPSVELINANLGGNQGDITDREFTLSIDLSQKSTWESSLVPHLDNLPFAYIGKGEQNCLKILLALKKKVTDAHILLIEEPENHLSYSRMNRLVRKIIEQCGDKQVLVATHSSYVLNKLGLDNLVLVSAVRGIRIADLPASTVDYFQKLSGYDTLRVILSKATLLVEGPSDELVVQRAYADRHDCLPIEHGIDVINVRGLAAKRFLDIARLLELRVAVVTDNDGKEPDKARERFKEYTTSAGITVHVGEDPAYPSLEQQIGAANDLNTLNSILKKSYSSKDELVEYMANPDNKTTCALAIFESKTPITMPKYINEAIDAVQ